MRHIVYLSYLLSVIVCLGDMYEIGANSGKYYTVNVPLKEGIDDTSKCILYSVYLLQITAKEGINDTSKCILNSKCSKYSAEKRYK